MIKPVKQKIAFDPKSADILYGENFIEREVEKRDLEHDILPINIHMFNQVDSWISLQQRFGMFITELKKECEYECVWTHNKFSWFYPEWLILRKNTSEYYRNLDKKNKEFTMLFDIAYWREIKREIIEEPDSLVCAFMGHGYTSGTLPSDGHGELKTVLVGLDNGDALWGHCWFWYNK